MAWGGGGGGRGLRRPVVATLLRLRGEQDHHEQGERKYQQDISSSHLLGTTAQYLDFILLLSLEFINLNNSAKLHYSSEG